MKKYIVTFMMAMLVFIAVQPIKTLAAGTESIALQVNGTKTAVVVTVPKAAGEKTSSLQLSLKVEADQLEGLFASFEFQEGIKGKIMEYRFNQKTGILNVYIAGTNPLFTEDSLQLGNVTIQTSDKNGVTANVSVVENSLKVVRGTKSEEIRLLSYPNPVKVVIGNGGNQENTPDTGDDNEGAGSGTDNGNGNQGGGSGADGGNGSQGGGSNTDGGSGSQGGGSNTDGGNGSQGGGSNTDGGNGSQGGGSGTDNGNGSQGGESGTNTGNGNQGTGSGLDGGNGNQSSEGGTDNSNTNNGVLGLTDKTALEKLLQLAADYKEEEYTIESFAVFREAFSNAQMIFKNPLASQADIDETILNLENAIGALQARNDASPNKPAYKEDVNTSSDSENVNPGNSNTKLYYIFAVVVCGIVLLGFVYRKLRRS